MKKILLMLTVVILQSSYTAADSRAEIPKAKLANSFELLQEQAAEAMEISTNMKDESSDYQIFEFAPEAEGTNHNNSWLSSLKSFAEMNWNKFTGITIAVSSAWLISKYFFPQKKACCHEIAAQNVAKEKAKEAVETTEQDNANEASDTGELSDNSDFNEDED